MVWLVILFCSVLAASSGGSKVHGRDENFFQISLGNKLVQTLLNDPDISGKCIEGFKELLYNLTDQFHLPLIVDMVDAFGKLEPGYLMGNRYSYGSYDECLGINMTQYCLATLVHTSEQGEDIPSLRYELGMCLPQECTKTDIEVMVNATQYFSLAGNVSCEAQKWSSYNIGAKVMIAVCCLFVILVAIGTIIDLLVTSFCNRDSETLPVSVIPGLVQSDATKNNLCSKKSAPLNFIIAFSLYKTVPMILATKQSPSAITSINGIRVMSMFWVIICHTHFWVLVLEGIDNSRYVLSDVAPRFTFQVITNGFFSVDSFFFLSGVLATYLTLREMARRKGSFPILMYYIHRYLRLTPTLVFVMFFAWFLTVHLADGPIYNRTVGEGSAFYEGCEKYWWTNILYINNLYPVSSKGCMNWLWYLANDMQFFIVAPLMIVPLFHSLPVGLVCVSLFLAGSFAATGVISGYYNIQANMFASLLYSYVPDKNIDWIYVRPYHRIPPYIVGIVLGYLLYRKARLPFGKQWNRLGYSILWVLAAVVCMSTLFGLYPTWHDHVPSLAENVIYLMFSSFAWGVGLAFVVFSCHNGYGGVINVFLSMKFWIPLSRLTFSAYLIHPVVLTVIFFSSSRQPFHYTDIAMAVYAAGAVVISYGIAAIIATCVEFPLANLESALFRSLGVSTRESTRQGTQVPVGSQNQSEPPASGISLRPCASPTQEHPCT